MPRTEDAAGECDCSNANVTLCDHRGGIVGRGTKQCPTFFRGSPVGQPRQLRWPTGLDA
jgi:hypothetical protein